MISTLPPDPTRSEPVAVAEVVVALPSPSTLPRATLIDAAGVPINWKPRSWPVRAWHGLWWLGEQVFGWLSLIVSLAVIATVPIAQFIALGYLLECSGRIVRSGKLRNGFIDLDRWSRLGGWVLGTYLVLLPLPQIAGLANDAANIQPGNPYELGLRILLFFATVAAVGHVLLAWYCGGKLRHFIWPLLAPFSLMHWLITRKVVGPIVRPAIQWIWPSLADDLYQPAPLSSWFPPAILWAGMRQGPVKMYIAARDAVWDFVTGLQLPHYLSLGFRGFLGALAWLSIPTLLVIAGVKAKNDGVAGLLATIGVISLATVIMYLPFLQVRFAAENRWWAMFQLGAVRKLFLKAPLSFLFALLMTLAFALPLYLFKVQKVFAEFDWLFSVFFVLMIYPCRLMTGWAVGYAQRREKASWLVTRWGARVASLAISLIYVGFVYLSQFTSWFGSRTLFEQHPFLLPVPFLGQ
jgi:hypothetical protein